MQARGYFIGRGESYADRRGSTKLPYWRQGKVDGKPFRWVGDPSHHNYSDVIHGLGQYYTLSAEGEQKERAREAIDAYWRARYYGFIDDETANKPFENRQK